jgi:hypothetical protein
MGRFRIALGLRVGGLLEYFFPSYYGYKSSVPLPIPVPPLNHVNKLSHLVDLES